MFTRAFGEVLATAMTVNPAIATIESASAILDTSNYTFQAVTLGKDADGFNFHAHSISSTSYVDGSSTLASSYNGGYVVIVNYGPTIASGASSYVFSATELEFSSTYSSLPQYPSPYDTRLQRGSTSGDNISNYQYASSIPDLGHYGNPYYVSGASSILNVLGGYMPPNSNTQFLFFSAVSAGAPTQLVFTGTLSGVFNTEQVVDQNGYIKFNTLAASDSVVVTQGAYVVGSTGFQTSSAGLKACVVPRNGDAAALAAFGGVKVMGLYCLDLNAMLAAGLRPPFSWSNINNDWVYKLVLKSTIVDNAMWHQDGSILNLSGFQDVINGGLGFTYGGPVISISIDFK